MESANRLFYLRISKHTLSIVCVHSHNTRIYFTAVGLVVVSIQVSLAFNVLVCWLLFFSFSLSLSLSPRIRLYRWLYLLFDIINDFITRALNEMEWLVICSCRNLHHERLWLRVNILQLIEQIIKFQIGMFSLRECRCCSRMHLFTEFHRKFWNVNIEIYMRFECFERFELPENG